MHVVEDDHEAEKLHGVHDETGGDGDLCHHVLVGLHLPAESLEEAVESRPSIVG